MRMQLVPLYPRLSEQPLEETKPLQVDVRMSDHGIRFCDADHENVRFGRAEIVLDEQGAARAAAVVPKPGWSNFSGTVLFTSVDASVSARRILETVLHVVRC